MKSHYMNNILQYFWSDKCYLDFFENFKKLNFWQFDNVCIFTTVFYCIIVIMYCIKLTLKAMVQILNDHKQSNTET